MKDRVVQYPNRYKLTPVSGDIYDLVPQQGTVTEQGTPLNKATLLDSTAQTMYALGDNGTVSEALKRNAYASYLAFVGNVNATQVDAAFGKNNEAYMGGIGYALALYAKYKTPSINILTKFPNLIQCNNLTEINNNASARTEVLSDTNISNFVKSNAYAKSKVPNVFPSLSSCTWSQINTYSTSGMAATIFKIGDEKNITLSTGETLTLVILDFNHDDLQSGGKAGITFGLKNLMASTRQMNAQATNSGGFTGSAMYSWLQNTLLTQLPSDLQSVLKTVNKKTSAGSQSSTINTNAMKLFLFSEVEVLGSTSYSFSGEGTQYAYFVNSSNRIKKQNNGSGTATSWWGRSPFANNSTNFCVVDNGGNRNHNGAGYSWGVCFGFCV